MQSEIKLLFKAQSIIQREALLAELASEGIEAMTTPRDMSRKIADDTVDLALEGYSVFFDGFPIYVSENDLSKAEAIVGRVLSQAEVTAGREKPLPEDAPHFHKFFFCSMFTFIVPGLMHMAGLYHLYMGFKTGERIPLSKFVIFLAMYMIIPVCFFYYMTLPN